ncbi:MAG: hypothetical protein HY064_11775 [Bacteroidetes bacterium]|nr:hypothetical protein [Bacteroidota bacterium]
MKKILLPIAFLCFVISACGGADEAAKKMLDSMKTDSINNIAAKKRKDDSIKLAASVDSSSKAERMKWLSDSTMKADSMKKNNKKSK